MLRDILLLTFCVYSAFIKKKKIGIWVKVEQKNYSCTADGSVTPQHVAGVRVIWEGSTSRFCNRTKTGTLRTDERGKKARI